MRQVDDEKGMCYTNSVLEFIFVYSLDSLIIDAIPSTCYEATVLVARITLDDYETICSVFYILPLKEGAERDTEINS